MTLMTRRKVRVAIDTSAQGVRRLADGAVVVRLRYDLPDGLTMGGVRFHRVESEEVPECEHTTARLRFVVLFDSTGAPIARVPPTGVDSVGDRSMIGTAGIPLCAYLRRGPQGPR